jgi:hypothetical protein
VRARAGRGEEGTEREIDLTLTNANRPIFADGASFFVQTSRHVEQVVSNLPPNFTCVHSWGHGGGAERDPAGVMEALVSLVGCVPQHALLRHKQMRTCHSEMVACQGHSMLC